MLRSLVLERCLKRLEWDRVKDKEAKEAADAAEAERMAMQARARWAQQGACAAGGMGDPGSGRGHDGQTDSALWVADWGVGVARLAAGRRCWLVLPCRSSFVPFTPHLLCAPGLEDHGGPLCVLSTAGPATPPIAGASFTPCCPSNRSIPPPFPPSADHRLARLCGCGDNRVLRRRGR